MAVLCLSVLLIILGGTAVCYIGGLVDSGVMITYAICLGFYIGLLFETFCILASKRNIPKA